MTKLEMLLSIPKSLYVSYKLGGVKSAWKCPIFVRYNTKLSGLKGSVRFADRAGTEIRTPKTATLKVGFGDVGIFDKRYQRAILEINGDIIVGGKASLGMCSRICVMPGGKLTVGENFSNTAKLTICCAKSVSIGNNFLASWDTMIMDTDWHEVKNTLTGQVGPKSSPVTIGNNVWMGMRSVVLKGSAVPDGCIIGAQSVVNKNFDESDCLLAGSPCKVRKRNVRIKRT